MSGTEKSPGLLSPRNKSKGPLDRFFNSEKAKTGKKFIPNKPDPEVIVPDTTDCIDLSSESSCDKSSQLKNSDLKEQVIEETMAESDAEQEDDEEDELKSSLIVSDSGTEHNDENEEKSGRESKTSGKRSASSAKIEAPGSATTTQKKRRRLSLEEKKAREVELDRRKREREEKLKEKEQRKLELEKSKKDRADARQQKIEAMKQAEKEREEKRKQEALDKEEKRKQTEEKRKQEALEKEEKRKQAEREREEKRKLKEAEKLALEEAKRKKLEEEQAKKHKAALLFKRHFVVVQDKDKSKTDADDESAHTSYRSYGPWKMFQLRPFQKLSPICRLSKHNRELAKSELDKAFDADVMEDTMQSLLQDYKTSKRSWRSSRETFPKPDVELVQLDENHDKSVMKAKLLQFEENIRPPYFGTWRKQSKFVRPRKPFGEDKEVFDYECNSADEWEEPEEGEDIADSSKESDDDDDPGSDEEVEDGFIVPHGYLSSDEEEACEEEENLNLAPTELKTRNRIQDNYELGFKKLAKSLRPIFFGPDLVDSGRPTPIDLTAFQSVFYEPIPPDFEAILCSEVVVPDPDAPVAKEAEKTADGESQVPVDGVSSKKSKLSKDGAETASPAGKVQKKPIPEEGIPHLIRFIHGNPAGIGRLIDGFIEHFAKEPTIGCEVSKRQVERQIFSIAERTVKPEIYAQAVWYVRDDVLAKYGITDLPVPNVMQSPAPKKTKRAKTGEEASRTPKAPTATTPRPPSRTTPKPSTPCSPKLPPGRARVTPKPPSSLFQPSQATDIKN